MTMYCDQVYHVKRIEKINHIIFSDHKDTEKAFDNIQYPFTIKVLCK